MVGAVLINQNQYKGRVPFLERALEHFQLALAADPSHQRATRAIESFRRYEQSPDERRLGVAILGFELLRDEP